MALAVTNEVKIILSVHITFSIKQLMWWPELYKTIYRPDFINKYFHLIKAMLKQTLTHYTKM
jgi:hypothetical protein